MIHFIIKYWRGEYPLWVSYWIVGVLLSFFVFAVTFYGFMFFEDRIPYTPFNVGLFAFSTFGFFYLVTFWQIIGLARSAGRYIEINRTKNKSGFWGYVVYFVVFVAIMQVAVVTRVTTYPFLADVYGIVFLNDPRVEDFSFEISHNGRILHFSGGIKYGVEKEITRLLDVNKNIETISLHSGGGRVREAEKLYDVILNRKLNTFVEGYCASACTLMFIAGQERRILPSARLGFHSPHAIGIDDYGQSPIVNRWKDRMAERGISRSFANRALSEPFTNMWYPSIERLMEDNVITGIGMDDNLLLDVYEFRMMLINNNEFFRVVAQYYTESFDTLTRDLHRDYLDGADVEIIIARLSLYSQNIISNHALYIDDKTMHQKAYIVRDQLEILVNRDDNLCYDYAQGEEYVYGLLANVFPESLITRERELMIQSIISSSRNINYHQNVDTSHGWNNISNILTQTYGNDALDIFSSHQTEDVKKREVCRMFITFFDAITRKDERIGAGIMREIYMER